MTAPSDHFNRDAYIDLIKRSIATYLYLVSISAATRRSRSSVAWTITTWSGANGRSNRFRGPATLLRKAHLDLVEQAILTLEEQKVPGDFIEAGIWRGGAIILMRAMIEAYRLPDRKVLAADSFAGIPKNTWAINDPVDLWRDRWIASSKKLGGYRTVRVADEKIVFVPGYFSGSLKKLSRQKFALLRLDSDSHDSVDTSLEQLYPLMSEGGIIIIDDWHLPECRLSVMNYRSRHDILDEIRECEGNAYWIGQQSYTSARLP